VKLPPQDVIGILVPCQQLHDPICMTR
jgi:hypothetical protein